MSYRWVEHTGELELEIEAPTRQAVFIEALRALAELLDEGGQGETVSQDVTVECPERAALLAEWLNELVYLAETADLVPDQLDRIELSDLRVAATVRFHRGGPRHVVKGATYHRLAFERSGDGFRATVVLDV